MREFYYPSKSELLETFYMKDDELYRVYINGEHVLVVNKPNTTQGYCCVSYKGHSIKYHTIKFILVNGDIEDKTLVLDHKNGDRVDNSMSNLRLVTLRENGSNLKIHRESNSVAGIRFKNGKYQVRAKFNKITEHFGVYDTKKEAIAIRSEVWDLLDSGIPPWEIRFYLGVAQYSSDKMGVSFDNKSKKWRARLFSDLIPVIEVYLGFYETEEQAKDIVCRAEERVDMFESVEQFQKLLGFSIKQKAEKKSSYKGVSWSGPKQCWQATIYYKGVKLHKGYFKNEEDAIKHIKKERSKLGLEI